MNLRLWRLWRHLWAGPNTLFGLLIAWLALMRGAQVRRVAGVVEVCGGRLFWPGCRFAAITMGHVVIAQSEQAMADWRAHERVHVAQYERWGPLFVPAYLACSAVQWARGRDPYLDNPFEKSAFKA